MADPFPGYDVLAKRTTPSWNEKTREVVDRRLAQAEREDVLTPRQLATLRRLLARIAPQPEGRPPANPVALLLDRIARDDGDGYRPASLPRLAEAWPRGLDAIEAEAGFRHDSPFSELSDEEADELLRSIAAGKVQSPAWENLPAKPFWSSRVLPDIVGAHWAHPSLWSAMGFGGPAAPRGYVRLDANRRDPWEAKEERGPDGADR